MRARRPAADCGPIGSVEGHDQPHGIVAEASRQGFHYGEHMWPVRLVAQEETGGQRFVPALKVPAGPLRGLSRKFQLAWRWANYSNDFRGPSGGHEMLVQQ